VERSPEAVSQAIERLLEEVRAMAGPLAWQKVDQLVHELVQLYGEGLARLMERLAGTGALDDRLRAQLADDELLASLLALHGLHPLAPEARIARALAAAAPALGPRVSVELVGLEAGEARLRVAGPIAAGAARALERLVADAAPEVARVLVDGLPAAPPSGLIQIDLQRSRARAGR
jgi:hypothetical protein